MAGGINTYVYVDNKPLNQVDVFGLETYMCESPLHALGGTGRKSGPDIWGNLLYHQYICVKQGGVTTCGGQDRTGGPYSPGKPSEGDKYNPQNCDKKNPDNKCLEDCLLKKIKDPNRPYYGLKGPGTNCQEWADDTYETCVAGCK